MVTPDYESEVLRGRLKWLLSFRLIIAVVAVGAILALEGKFTEIPSRYYRAYIVLIFAIGINVLYFLGHIFRWDPHRLAAFQIFVDVLIVSLLVYLTSIDKIFAYLYFAIVLGAAVLIQPKSAYFFASFATVMLSSIYISYFFSARYGVHLPGFGRASEQLAGDITQLIPYLLFFAFSLHVVAFLGAKLSEELGKVRVLNEEILRNMEGGVIAVNRERTIVYVNEQASGLLGKAEREISDREVRRVLSPELVELVQTTLATGAHVKKEIPYQDRFFDVSVSVLGRDRSGVRGAVVIIHDLTDRKKMAAMERKAERFRTLLELSAGMAHEIRNPLASIRGAAQELTINHDLTLDEKKLLRILMSESDRLDSIISNFLEFSSERPFQPQICNVNALLDETATLLRTRLPDSRVTIHVECESELTCSGVADQLKQVFLNIGLNSLDATSGGGSIRIKAGRMERENSAGKRTPWLRIEFSDTGVGIPREHLDRIFEPFFTSKSKGTGMGLAIARKIVQEHQGTIEIASQEGKGAHCTILLPLT